MKLNREGFSIIAAITAGAVILMVAFGFIFHYADWVMWPLWIIGGILFLTVLFTLWFFREPKRAHITDDEIVFSSADGKIVVIEKVFEKEYFNEERLQLSVFMSLTNVHINWFPVGGEIVYRKDHPGEYMVAWHPKSSEENERMTTVVDTGCEKILFRQIAGLLARRIVNHAEIGHQAVQNTKCGFIKFGSRVDIFLPLDAEILVKLGDRVTGSQTPLARLKR